MNTLRPLSRSFARPFCRSTRGVCRGALAPAILALALPAAVLALALPATAPALAQSDDDYGTEGRPPQAGPDQTTDYTPYQEADNAGPSRYSYSDEAPLPPSDYFGRVRAVEGDPGVVRGDGTTESLLQNGPVYAGDRIETGPTGRVEIQLPLGQIIRIDARSIVDLYALGENPRKDQEGTLIGLVQGSLQADVPAAGDVRIDTPFASVYPDSRAALRVDLEANDRVRISVEQGRVGVAGNGGSVTLRSGERTRVYKDSAPRQPIPYNLMVRDNFGSWVARRQDTYQLRAAPGSEYDDLPQEIRPYYDELSQNGTWVYTDEYGWTWKPGSVDDDWRPYTEGSWNYGPSGPVWVGDEPWGWAPYRYGRWEWSAAYGGWVWIPGAVFRPAHVYWYWGPTYVGWCPLGYWDSPVWISAGWYWGDPWFNGYPWTFVDYHYFYGYPVPRNTVPRGRVVPGELRTGVVARDANAVLTDRSAHKAVRRGDVTVRELSSNAYRVAREQAADGTVARRSGVRPVPTATDVSTTARRQDPRGRATAAPRRSFIEREREVMPASTATSGRSGKSGSAAAAGAVRRGSGGTRSAPGQPASAPRSAPSTSGASGASGSSGPSGSSGTSSGGGGRGGVRPRADADGGRPVVRIRPPEPDAATSPASTMASTTASTVAGASDAATPLVTNQPGAEAAAAGRRPVIRIRPDEPGRGTEPAPTPSAQTAVRGPAGSPASQAQTAQPPAAASSDDGTRRGATPDRQGDRTFDGWAERPINEVRPEPRRDDGGQSGGEATSPGGTTRLRTEGATLVAEGRLRSYPREAPTPETGRAGRGVESDRGAVREFFGRIAEEDRPAGRGAVSGEDSPRGYSPRSYSDGSGDVQPQAAPRRSAGDGNTPPPPPSSPREASVRAPRSGESARPSTPSPPPSSARAAPRSAPSGGTGGASRAGGGGGGGGGSRSGGGGGGARRR